MSYTDMDISSGKFLKIESGEPVDIHVLSTEPVKQIVHGYGSDKLSCVGDNCHMCADGEVPKKRWLINIYDRKEKKVKIFEFGATIARQIKAIAEMLAESQQTIHDIDLRIKAEGSGLSKEYTVINRPMTGDLPPDLKLHKII